MKKKVRQVVRRLLRTKHVNPLARRILRLPFVPKSLRQRLPVVGILKVRLPCGRTLRMHADESNSIAQRLNQNGITAYEPETLAVFLPLARWAKTLIDVGAHIGTLGLTAGVENPLLRVFAFEPVPPIFEQLRANIRLNRRAKITPVGSAVSDRDGTTTLYIPPGSLPTESSLYSGFRPGVVPIEVPMLRLDTYIEKHAIQDVDLMKIDAELFEAAVIAGAMNLIRRDLPLIICEVLADVDENAIHNQLDPLQYHYFWITEAGLVPQEHIQGDRTYRDLNFLFVPETKLDVLVTAGLRLAPRRA